MEIMKVKDIFIHYQHVTTKFKRDERDIIIQHNLCSGLICWSITQALLNDKIDSDKFNRIIIQDSTNSFNHVEKNTWRIDSFNNNLIIEIEFDIFKKFSYFYNIKDELKLNEYYIELITTALNILPEIFSEIKNSVVSAIEFLRVSSYKLRYLIKKKSIKSALKLNIYLAYHLTIFECYTLLYFNDKKDKLLCVSPVLFKSPPLYSIFLKNFTNFDIFINEERIKIELHNSSSKTIMELLYDNDQIKIINSIGGRYTAPQY